MRRYLIAGVLSLVAAVLVSAVVDGVAASFQARSLSREYGVAVSGGDVLELSREVDGGWGAHSTAGSIAFFSGLMGGTYLFGRPRPRGPLSPPPLPPVPATKKCPRCAESIQAEAILCRYCRSDIGTAPQSPAQ